MRRYSGQWAQWLSLFPIGWMLFCGVFVLMQPLRILGDAVKSAPYKSPFLFGHYPQCLHYSESIAHKVSNCL
jgi:hypothetical protein